METRIRGPRLHLCLQGGNVGLQHHRDLGHQLMGHCHLLRHHSRRPAQGNPATLAEQVRHPDAAAFTAPGHRLQPDSTVASRPPHRRQSRHPPRLWGGWPRSRLHWCRGRYRSRLRLWGRSVRSFHPQ